MSYLVLNARRSLAILLVVLLTVGLLPAYGFAQESNSFKDIEDHWAKESINKVVEEGLFQGTTESKFDPNGSMTRAMFITVLSRLAEKLKGPDVEVQAHSFKDVPENSWYADSVNWAVSAEITVGYGTDRFAPNDLLNREQITVLMIRFLTLYMGYDLGSYKSSTLFTDDEQISPWAKEAVYQAAALGLIQGESGNLFNAKGTANRAVVAVITERFLNKVTTLNVPTPIETPTPTPTPVVNQGGGNDTTITVTAATIQRNNTSVGNATLRSGDQLTVATTPSNANVTVKWLVNGVEKSSAATYTVQSFDVGAVITAKVTGTGKYIGTVTTAATGKVIASVDLSNTESNSSPVVIDDSVVYKDEDGNVVKLSDSDAISFSVTASETEVPVEEQTNVKDTLQEQFDNAADLNIDELPIHYFAIDAELLVDSEDGTSSVIHPVGKTTLTLSKANLGFSADEDISQHVFLIGHTNKNGDNENVLGQVVEIGGEQYVRVELNGLSTIYIGNVPPLTITFNTDGGSEIPAKKVKLGEITPEVTPPTKNGYFFLGWNIDLNNSPIFMDMTVTALWLEGGYVPADRLSLVDANDMEVDNYTINENGVVKTTLSESETYGANEAYTLNIKAPAEAASYVISNSAEAAEAATADDAVHVSGPIQIDVVITNENGKVITGSYSTFIKWFDEAGEPIKLESATVLVETDVRAATREKTFTVDRGVGTVEAMLLAKDGAEDYYAYINGYLNGSGVYDSFSLGLNASFDRYNNFTESSQEFDYSAYDGLKLIFTPFEGQSYDDSTLKASAYYWDKNNTQQTIELNAELNNEGQLEVTTKENHNLIEMAGTSYSLYLYVTVEVGDQTQRVNVNVNGLNNSSTGEDNESISTDKWTEVVEALKENENIFVYYYGPSINLDTKLVVKKGQELLLDSDLTIGAGGELQLIGSEDDAAYVNVDGDIVISNGGKVTTNAQLETQNSYYYTGLFAQGSIVVNAGGQISVPQHGLLSIRSENGLVVEQQGTLNINGLLDIDTNVLMHGNLNIVGSDENYYNYYAGNITLYGDITIDGVLEVSGIGNFTVSGMTTIQEDGELHLTKGQIELRGKTYNYGNITAQAGTLVLSNVGYAVNNDGVIELSANATLNLLGTTLVNNNEILGAGTIWAVETANAGANYDNGIEYVLVEGVESSSNYSRYKFVRDPEQSVTATIYESKISGTGTISENITISESKIPE